jgi:uncharacterized membrane protein YfcA
MKEKTIISATTLAISLLAYWYAKENEKDAAPWVMAGAFAGTIIGEGLADFAKKKKEGQ